MLRIAICDDEAIFRKQIHGLMDEHLLNLQGNHVITEFMSGYDLLECMEDDAAYDIVFLDMLMPDMDGVETARLLRNKFDQQFTILIYISSYDNRAKETFPLNAFRFLSKPIDTNLFREAVTSALQLLKNQEQDYYLFKDIHGTHYRLPYDHISHFLSCPGRKVEVVTYDNSYTQTGQLSQIYKTIKSSAFLLIHQSVLINYFYIQNISYKEVTLKNGTSIPIAGPRRRKVMEQYKELTLKEGVHLWQK